MGKYPVSRIINIHQICNTPLSSKPKARFTIKPPTFAPDVSNTHINHIQSICFILPNFPFLFSFSTFVMNTSSLIIQHLENLPAAFKFLQQVSKLNIHGSIEAKGNNYFTYLLSKLYLKSTH